MRRLLAFLALALLASGCMESAKPAPSTSIPGGVRDPSDVWPLLSKAVFHESFKEHDPVLVAPDVHLDSWIFRPRTDVATKAPVIINFSPYWGNIEPSAESGGDAFSQYLIDYFVPRGYAVVLVSERGTGLSDGCFDLGGKIEQDDARAVIHHYATMPWSNGRVGSGAKSYDGTTPIGAAVTDPPELRAIFPVSGITNFYDYTYYNGLSFGGRHGLLFNAGYPQDVGWADNATGIDPTQKGKPGTLTNGNSLLRTPVNATRGTHGADDLCADYAQQVANGGATAATGDYTPYWEERDYAKDAAKARAPMLYIQGLQDWNVKPSMSLPFLRDYGGPKLAWLHQSLDHGDGHVYPPRDDWNYTLLRFLDETLKGVDTGLFQEPPIQVEDTAHHWRYEEAWPPATATMDLHLSAGRLHEAPGVDAAATFRDNGLIPTFGAGTNATQLTYQGEPTSAELHFSGVPRLTLTVSTDKPLGKVAANLYDVDGTGARLIGWTGLNFRARDGPRSPQPVEAGAAYTVTSDFFPLDAVIATGHRIGLAIAGNAGYGDYEAFEVLDYAATVTMLEGSTATLSLPYETAPPQPVIPAPSYGRSCWAC